MNKVKLQLIFFILKKKYIINFEKLDSIDDFKISLLLNFNLSKIIGIKVDTSFVELVSYYDKKETLRFFKPLDFIIKHVLKLELEEGG